MKTTCKQAFEDGHKERLKYPLRCGEYKLKEALYDVVGSLKELERIADLKRARGGRARREKGYALRHCTTADTNQWLKDRPQYVARILSYSVIPATLALTGDGVPKSQVNQLLADAVRRSEKLLIKLEEFGPSHTIKNLLAEAIEVIELVQNNAGFKGSGEWKNTSSPLTRSPTAPFKT